LQAGADALQVGTATFRDPHAPWRVLRQLARWCRDHDTTVAGIRGRVATGASTTSHDDASADAKTNAKEDARG
jgi:hypothetical protein